MNEQRIERLKRMAVDNFALELKRVGDFKLTGECALELPFEAGVPQHVKVIFKQCRRASEGSTSHALTVSDAITALTRMLEITWSHFRSAGIYGVIGLTYAVQDGAPIGLPESTTIKTFK